MELEVASSIGGGIYQTAMMVAEDPSSATIAVAVDYLEELEDALLVLYAEFPRVVAASLGLVDDLLTTFQAAPREGEELQRRQSAQLIAAGVMLTLERARLQPHLAQLPRPPRF